MANLIPLPQHIKLNYEKFRFFLATYHHCFFFLSRANKTVIPKMYV